MAGVRIRVSTKVQPTKLQKRILAIIDSDRVRRGMNQIIAQTVEPFVPMDTGDLRRSVRVGPKTVAWTEPYARYQYYGEVYGPNFPIMNKGIIVGWYSPEKKHPTGRELGIPGEWMGWTFGYTTPGTGHHWIDKALSDPYRKRGMQIRITNYLKRILREKENGN